MALISSAETLGMLNALGGESVVYVSVGKPVYDTATGTMSLPKKKKYQITGVWTEYMREEIDGVNIRPEDAHFVTGAEDFPCTPTLNDQIQQGTAIWNVIRISNQPNDPFLDLQVRRSA